MANEFDFFPLFIRKLVVDTRDLSTLEYGAYWRLLERAWDEVPVGTIPDDDATLARWAGLSPLEWSAVGPAVLRRFQPPRNGRRLQKRMSLVHQKIRTEKKSKTEVYRANAKLRWDKGKDATAVQRQCNGIAKLKGNEKENSSTGGAPEPAGAIETDPWAGLGPEFAAAAFSLREAGIAEHLIAPLVHRHGPGQVTVALANARELQAAGKLTGTFGGYVIRAIEERYAQVEAVGRREMATAKQQTAVQLVVQKKRAAETERAAREREEAEMSRLLARTPAEQLEAAKADYLQTLDPYVRGRLEKQDVQKNPVLRAAVYGRLTAA